MVWTVLRPFIGLNLNYSSNASVPKMGSPEVTLSRYLEKNPLLYKIYNPIRIWDMKEVRENVPNEMSFE